MGILSIMKISVNFLGPQRKQLQTDRIRIPLSDGVRVVSDLFGYMAESFPELSIQRDMVLVTVNNRVSGPDQRLRDNDEIAFIPHIGGG